MNNNNERVIAYSRYNYYKYYNANKENYRRNDLEKKRRDAIEAEHKDYYKDYWTLSLWKSENMREYKKK